MTTTSEHGEHAHVVPVWIYFAVFGTLMVLTAATVWAAGQDFGPLNTVVAIGIAITKATLVVLFFMHVKYSAPLVKLCVAAALVFLGLLGPGLIAANAGNDAGGVATYSEVGARYGYTLLWAMVLITVSLALVQRSAARMGTVTGKGLAALIRENYGVRITFASMLALLVANQATTISEFAGVAASLELFGIPRWLGVPVVALVVWYVVTHGNYKDVEKIFLLSSLFFLAYVVSGLLVSPPWGQVLRETVTPG